MGAIDGPIVTCRGFSLKLILCMKNHLAVNYCIVYIVITMGLLHGQLSALISVELKLQM